ncbi:helix-turn-helix transcriptional regulator [Streptomyces somaliensis]|uniref:helix-turn-helix domain-containing protein n=1 Tax=Streptomyces somaliensis TaxID=78355 RepID=UPI0020CD6FC5|nr:helix-turn-helix transcriptional regulator [Streptomyces somaliensis]MCP9945108.1 helix-turn-helix transcriptional regulator [Streptomyces somaliensis]MCP9961677.1 helix-turn-helix transcriptional regulator [Streptomyces somaliensis]MCP9974490.1 helix-turn-helix transcriptional regulator [Streptomyces somaliensis]
MSDWDAGPEDEEAGAVIKAVARQLKLWREAAGLTQAEFGAAIGYGEELVSSVERGRRIPRPEYLDAADRVLEAGGRVVAMGRDLAETRYPKKVRDLKRLEADAVELCAYNNSVIHGLLQSREYAREIFNARRPAFTEEEVEQQVAARLARQEILDPTTGRRVFSFVQCESTLRRPIGGKMVLRKQLERLLEVGQWRNVDLQVLPLDREENSGTDGSFRLLKLKDGATVAFSEAPLSSRVMTDPKETTVLDIRYGVIRAQALSPQESLAFIEKALGETKR